MTEILISINEAELLKKIAKGDEHAFRIIFNTYQKKIYTSAHFMLKDDMLAEEVVQETMLKLWLLGDHLNDITNLKSYLLKISRNKAFDLLRRKETRNLAEQEAQTGLFEPHNETEEQVLLNETKKILEEAINKLPSQQKQVYTLCHQEGLKYEEAARQLNISVETVRSYMRLAQLSIRNHVRSHISITAVLIIFNLM